MKGKNVIDRFDAADAAVFSTDLGWIAVHWRDGRVARVAFGYPSRRSVQRAMPNVSLSSDHLHPSCQQLVEKLKLYAAGVYQTFGNVPLDWQGLTEFQRVVLRTCRQIPWGDTWTYAVLAQHCGKPRAARAVGSCMARNPFSLIVPCHRVVGTGPGNLGGFSAPGGLRMKRRLLQIEQAAR
jgi:methylated-DNA-[protein]-cysteine S-methyltransferase